ncbi:hypothetical protein [Algiphilus aromaticivorans]|uniref:hypothetical protein n=1 Tax=Algiphilus aromaticivorans TaxID=382454 RepID=UPI0005C1FAA3|nr:hypothetical protein [Algiphilus aromaticivorans]
MAMRTKASDWYAPNTGRTLYGIKVYHEGKWAHAMQDGKPLIFHSELERDEKRRELRKQVMHTVHEWVSVHRPFLPGAVSDRSGEAWR